MQSNCKMQLHLWYNCIVKKRGPTICPIVFSLDIFGDKWSLVILRDVLIRNKSHFLEFLKSEEKMASNILSSKLEILVTEGLLTKEADLKNKSASIYKPTKKALDLLPTIFELMRWGIQYNQNSDISGPVMKELMNNPEELRKRVLKEFESVLH